MFSSDLFLLKCPTYESYLDTFVKPADRYYLRDDALSRMLVRLEYRTSGSALYTPEQFTKLKAQLLESLFPRKKTTVLFSSGSNSWDPVVRCLAQRELPNVQKAISTIIFVKYRTKSGFDLSSFIDYEHSLRHKNMGEEGYPDWKGIFNGRATLFPQRHDLSFYDWRSGAVHYNNSDNYIINHDRNHGLLFMFRGDHKKICADYTNKLFKMNSDYLMVHSDEYGEVIFYDHVIRKKI